MNGKYLVTCPSILSNLSFDIIKMIELNDLQNKFEIIKLQVEQLGRFL